MNKYLPLYIKAFLYFTFGFGIPMNILLPTTLGFIFGYSWHGIVSEMGRTAFIIWAGSIAFGLLCSLGMVTIHILRVRSLPTRDAENVLSLIQIRSIRLPISQETAFKTCIASLMIVSAKVLEQENLLRIKAQTPFGGNNSLEQIEFNLTRINDSETHVTFTCRPKLKTTLVDFGASIDVAEKIYWYLEEKIK